MAVRIDCDPLSAGLARKLNAYGRPLLAVLSEKQESYLATQARAELAASLAVVRYVTIDADLAVAEDLRREEETWRGELESVVLAKSRMQ